MIVPLVVVALLAQQSYGASQDDVRIIQHRLRLIFVDAMDFNSDGETTVEEALQFFRLRDNGDCQWTYNEFRGPVDATHGAAVYTEEQLRAIFTFYDTVGCTRTADGLFTCNDIPILFNSMDSDNDNRMSRIESEDAALYFAQRMAAIIPTGRCP